MDHSPETQFGRPPSVTSSSRINRVTNVISDWWLMVALETVDWPIKGRYPEILGPFFKLSRVVNTIAKFF